MKNRISEGFEKSSAEDLFSYAYGFKDGIVTEKARIEENIMKFVKNEWPDSKDHPEMQPYVDAVRDMTVKILMGEENGN